MIIKRASELQSSQITPESLYRNRRQFIGTAGAAMGMAFLPYLSPSLPLSAFAERGKGGEVPNSYDDITHYNN